MTDEDLNTVKRGFLWSLWNLIPLAGPIIYLYKVTKVTLESTGSRIALILLLYLAPLIATMGEPTEGLVIGCVWLLGIFFLWYLIVKKIGWRFFWGTVVLPGLISVVGILAAITIPMYQRQVEKARQHQRERESVKQQSYIEEQTAPKEMLLWTFLDKSAKKPGFC